MTTAVVDGTKDAEVASLLPYPAYKLSGVGWLGDVPAHWAFRRGKRLFQKMERAVRQGDEVVTCFRDGVVTLRKNRREDGFTESLKEIGYQGIRRGDLVIHAMDAFAGAIGVSDSDGKGTPVYSVCKPAPEADAYYYAYALREMSRNRWIEALAKGIRERSSDFRFSEFGLQTLPLPPLHEQRAIVRYLNHVDDRIRRYVTAKEKLIALLEEERQAIIQRAVTRGLDPNVPLKPSGVEWLRDIPAHWDVGRISATARGGTDSFTDGDWVEVPHITDSGVRLIQTGNIGIGSFREQGYRYISDQSFNDLRCTEVRPGDVLICRLANPVGRACLAPDLGVRMITSVDVCILRSSDRFSAQYLVFLLSSKMYLDHVASIVRGGTRDRISRSMLGTIKIANPPTFEQIAIVEYLDKATADIDSAINRARRQIELLREYRTRLIADVVTGKLDVREAAAQLPGEADDGQQYGERAVAPLAQTET